MGELGLNKILGALLATALGLFGLHELSAIVFSHASEGHHGDEHHEPQSMTEQMCGKFAYCVEIAGGGSAAVEEEEVYDLGLLLANADMSRGERVFKGQCTTCHTIESGGANGTGPNLYNVIGADKGAHDGFSYSAALLGVGGSWTYENMDAWLMNPSSYARGTSMSFAGIRRDADRASVIAYLTSFTDNAPDFPAPLDAVEDAAEEAVEAAGEALEDAVEGTVDAATDAGEAMVEDASEAVESVVDGAAELVEEGAEAAEEAVETVEDAVEEATDGN